MHALGIDVGGSSLKGAPVDLTTGQLLAPRHRIETPTLLEPPEMAAAVAQLAQHFSWKGPIGCGFPGVVREGVVTFLGNLSQSFVGMDIDQLLTEATRCPVEVINDADAAGWAEVRFGAGRGRHGSVLMLTFGTGVGSGLFLDGRLVPNTELGHIPMHGQSAERWVAASVKDKEQLSYAAWAARVNDYLRLVVNLINPALVIIGGGISADHAQWFPYLDVPTTKIVPAEFFNEAGIVGAALAAER
jgi:polyphosphate glucokinase